MSAMLYRRLKYQIFIYTRWVVSGLEHVSRRTDEYTVVVSVYERDTQEVSVKRTKNLLIKRRYSSIYWAFETGTMRIRHSLFLNCNISETVSFPSPRRKYIQYPKCYMPLSETFRVILEGLPLGKWVRLM
jgi:hypothetical protein